MAEAAVIVAEAAMIVAESDIKAIDETIAEATAEAVAETIVIAEAIAVTFNETAAEMIAVMMDINIDLGRKTVAVKIRTQNLISLLLLVAMQSQS